MKNYLYLAIWLLLHFATFLPSTTFIMTQSKKKFHAINIQHFEIGFTILREISENYPLTDFINRYSRNHSKISCNQKQCHRAQLLSFRVEIAPSRRLKLYNFALTS